MYTAGKFQQEINRIFVAAEIGHIRYFTDGFGSSGTMLSFGPSKRSAYFLVESLGMGDRFKVYQFRTLAEIVKEVKNNFNKYIEMFPRLKIVIVPELLKDKKYDKSVTDSIKHFFKRDLEFNLVRQDFRLYKEGASLYFKKVDMFSKKQLFDFLVAKYKLNMDYFEKFYGVMEEGEDISERIKHYKYGPWDIYLDTKTKRGVDEVKQLLNDACKDLKKRGYGKLCYGKIFLVDNLGGNKLADYNEENDTMRIGFKMLKKSNAQNQKIAFIHEIGHRNYYKFLKNDQRKEINSKYFLEVKFASPDRSAQIGEVLTDKNSGDRFKVEKKIFKRTINYLVKLIEFGENTKMKSKDLNEKFTINDKYVGSAFIIEGKEMKENTYVSRPYAMKNEREFYAVLWETWFQNKLKDPAKVWFEGIER